MEPVSIDSVRDFWESHPLCAASIEQPLGSPAYFAAFNRMRERIEPLRFAQRFYEFYRHRGRAVLDVGCGNGYVLSHYAKAGAIVTGVDLTDTAVRLSRERFRQAGLPGTFEVANAEALPFPDASFDAACSMGVLHHTPDPAKGVAEVHRVLRPGGRIYVMFYHRGSAWYRWKMPLMARAQGKPLTQIVNQVDGMENPKGEVYSRDQLRALLRDFREIELFSRSLEPGMILPARLVVGGRPQQIFDTVAHQVLRPLERWWGWFLYARATKPV